MKKAFIFDLNGTMIDDMEFHLDAWFEILNNNLGAGLNREQVRSHMYGRNDELLKRVFGDDRFTADEMDNLSLEKEKRYQKTYRQHLRLIPGLHDFLKRAANSNIALAIGSAAIPFNIDFVLDNLAIREFFPTIVSATDVAHSKPHPETYVKAAQLLNVSPSKCLVFEDAPKGVEAAQRAGMECVVITTMHGPEEFSNYDNIVFFVHDFHDQRLSSLLQ